MSIYENRKIRHYERRFGAIAIRKGFITRDDLVQGRAIQVSEDLTNGHHLLLGEAFFRMGLMTDRQVNEVLQEIFSSPPDMIRRGQATLQSLSGKTDIPNKQ